MKTFGLIFALIGGWVALTIVINRPSRQLRQLAEARGGIDAFASVRESLPDIAEDLLLDVYRAVQDLVPYNEFPVKADDNLWETLEIDQGSLQDLIEELVGIAGQERAPIDTFADLAKAVWFKKQSTTG
jgi:hypothetical protein